MKIRIWLGVVLVWVLSGSALAQETISPIQTPWTASKKWALCMGASNYQSIGKLEFSSSDAISFGKALVEDLGFQSDSVKILADADGYQPTNAENLKATLDTFLKNPDLDRGDLFILYFSGHGVGLPSGDYWLPTDAKPENYEKVGINVKQVITRLKEAGLKQILVIADACRAGFKSDFGSDLIKVGDFTNTAVILGCQPGEKSYELKRYGKGALTYFLLKGLKNKDLGLTKEEKLADDQLRVISAMTLGRYVQSAVEDYTKADYGDNAQRPWAKIAGNQEVLLAVSQPKEPNILKIISEANKSFASMNVPEPGRQLYLHLLGTEYAKDQQYEKALTCYKAAEALGELHNVLLLHYAFTLSEMGRQGELTRLLQRHLKGDVTSSGRRAGAALLGTPQLIGKDLYEKALQRLLQDLDNDFDRVSFELTVRDSKLGASSAEKVAFLRANLGRFKPNSRPALFFLAKIELLYGRYAPALAFLEQAEKASEADPSQEEIAGEKFRCYKQLDKTDLIRKTIEEELKRSPNSSKWLAEKAILEADLYDPEESKDSVAKLEAFKAFLNSPSPSPYILEVMPHAGQEIALMVTEIAALQKRFPYAVNVGILSWVTNAMKDSSFSLGPPAELLELSSDRPALLTRTYSFARLVMERVLKDRPQSTDIQRRIYREILLGAHPHLLDFEKTEDSIYIFALLLKAADFPMQAWMYYCHELAEKHPEYNESELLLVVRHSFALSAGDFELARTYWRTIQTKSVSPTLPAFKMAFAYLQRGLRGEALAILKAFESRFTGGQEILKMILEVSLAETQVEAKKIADKYKDVPAPNLPWLKLIGRALSVLAQGEKVDLGLIASLSDGDSEWNDMRINYLKQFLPLIEKSDDELIRGLGKVLYLQMNNQSGNFAILDMPIHPNAPLSEWDGDYIFKLRQEMGTAVSAEQLTLQIKSGLVKGSMTSGKTVFTLEGTVDANGNLQVDLSKDKGVVARMYCKMPSLKRMTTDKDVKWSEKILFNFIAGRCYLCQLRGALQSPTK